MKVFPFYLAFLIIVISFLPYILSSYIANDNTNKNSPDIKLYNHTTKKIYKLNFEDYIVGVVCAEMPASFSKEALKAQAVAARTYAIRKSSNDTAHNGADVCTDFSHCQAFASEDESRKKWGTNYNKYISKIKKAVYDTAGEFIAYENEPAMTVFHSCSNGITEKASDVWSSHVPYLVNVESPGDDIYKDYISECRYDYNEFVTILENYLKKPIDINYSPVGEITYTAGNNVSSIFLFGNRIEGIDIRKIFSLKSTSFSLEYKDNSFIFSVAGNGHGVGMSQYGAESMARNGSSYIEILKHYYPGTEIALLNK